MAKNNRTLQDSEDVFLTDVLEKYKFWKRRVKELENDRRNATKEREYAEAFKLLLNQFSYVEKQGEIIEP